MTSRFSGMIVLTTLCLAARASAQSEDVSGDGWEFNVTPYFLAAGWDGKIGMAGVTTSVDEDDDTIWSMVTSGVVVGVGITL